MPMDLMVPDLSNLLDEAMQELELCCNVDDVVLRGNPPYSGADHDFW